MHRNRPVTAAPDTSRMHPSARRRAIGAACALAALGAGVPGASAVIPEGDGGGTSRLPVVNMERALLAAQVDPGRPGTGITRGARRSVVRIERALHRRGLLARRYVDGHFGSSTVSAYSRWQQRLGYSGLAANGLPGETSLKRLGRGRFRVRRVVSVGPRVTLPGGAVVNRRTNRMKMAAGNRLGGCRWSVTQGSYNAGGVSASAGTHDGGGALDLSVNRGCGTRRHAVRALRKVGFAAWYRPTRPGVWPAHIHAIAVNDSDLSAGAAAQVSEYYRGYDGLAGDGRDTGPRVRKVTWEQYRRSR